MQLVFFTELPPAAFLTVRVTVYIPALVYLCEGLLVVEVLLSPKSQDHEAGDPVLLSVNFTVNGAFPDAVDTEKEATGFITTVIYFDFVIVLLPAALLAVSTTV